MQVLENAVYKSDGETQDVCPTCGARTRTTTPADPQTAYRIGCAACPWSVDLDHAPPGMRNRLVTDGGVTTDETESAQDVLDTLHSDSRAATLAEHLATGNVELELQDILRPLGLAGGDLCIEVEHRNKTEFIALAEEWDGFASTTRKPDGTTWGPIKLDRDDLERRLSKPIDVRLTANLPVDLGGVE